MSLDALSRLGRRLALDAGGDAQAGPRRRRLASLARGVLAAIIAQAPAIVLLAGALALRAADPAFLQQVRSQTFDAYQRLWPRSPTSYPVTIVDIDEASLARHGQWPWSRALLAELTLRLAKMGATAIGFDMVFAEADRLSPRQLANELTTLDESTRRKLRQLPGSDEALARSFASARVVLGQGARGRTEEAAPAPPPFAIIGSDPRPWLVSYGGVVRNIPALESAAAGLGMFSQAPELDGVVRRLPAVMRVDEAIYPSLALEMLRVATGQSAIAVRTDEAGVDSVVVAGVRIPTDEAGRVWPRYGPHDDARFVSAAELLAGLTPPERVRGKLVLIGTSAEGLRDVRGTPLGVEMAGVEIQAQLLEAIIAGDLLHRPHYALGAELVVIAAAGLLMIVFVPLVGSRWTLLVLAAVAASLLGFSARQFAAERQLIDVTFALALATSLYVYLTWLGYMRSEASRKQVREALRRYVSPELADSLARDPSRLRLGGERRVMSILFCDLRNFTSLAEGVQPELLTTLLNRFMTRMTKMILIRSGTIDKYMGDAVMAFWNAPLDDPHHASNACRTALAMVQKLEPLNRELMLEAAKRGGRLPPFEIGVGVNTGECLVGNMGSKQRFDYSVLGDAVNLASRLEGLTKLYGVPIVVGEETARQAAHYAFLELDLIRVKGKQRPTRIFALLGDASVAASSEFADLRRRQETFLAAYRRRDFKAAAAALQDLLDGCAPDWHLEKLCEMFSLRLDLLAAADLPDDWDGVFTSDSK